MALNEQHYSIIDLPEIMNEELDSFSDLPFDPYMGNNRFRRFSQYRMSYSHDRWAYEKLPQRPYVTYSKYNNVAGGIKRYYEPILMDFSRLISAGAEEIDLDTTEDWQINVHQYRVIVGQGIEGVVVPEGVHQDGHEYVMIAVFKRQNITGAEMSLLPLDKGKAFFRTTVMEGQAALIDDRKMFHYVSNIESNNDGGYRDIIVVAFSRWADKWYGDEFENNALDEVEVSEVL